jgi:site-specific recombinase XerD
MDTSADDINPDVLQLLVAEITQENLEPLTPVDGLEMYVQTRGGEVASSTLRTHQSRLQYFVDWCEENGIQNLNNLTGRDLLAFRNWRKQELATPSLRSNLQTLRVFLNKCVQVDAVPSDLPEKVDVPSGDAASRDEIVSAEQAEAILTHLNKYQYATTEHVCWVLIIAGGCRISGLRAIDLTDFTTHDTGGQLIVHHRPDSGTSLKNGQGSERVIHISDQVCDVLTDYVEDRRPDVLDEYGRAPLLASQHGRLAESTIRKYAYKWTRPCVISGDCPHDVEIDECDAAQSASAAYDCPSSKSPHPIRRGYITYELSVGVPEVVVGDRCDVSPDVIEQAYDERNETEKMEVRKAVRESSYADSDKSGYGQ